ncbi:MAG: TolB family protein [Bryobacteraceae bacterium]
MIKGITRRAMYAALPGGLVAASMLPVRERRALPQVGEFFRFFDPATETVVVRLTSPATSGLLPAASNRFVSSKRRFLIFSSDRTGKRTPFQVDLRTGRLRQLAETAGLAPLSLCMDQTERFLYFIDRGALKEVALANLRTRTLTEDVSAFTAGRSSSEFFVVRNGQLQQLARAASTLADNIGSSFGPLLRPGGAGCFFLRDVSTDEREFWYAPLRDATSKPIVLAKGRVSNPIWSPDGRSLLFLREVQANVLLSEVHEVFPETGAEQRVAPTSQFAAFAPNGDASVFVGASRSKAQPNIVLLLRAVKRELTLCEHRASRPAAVSPVFSPDSRRVYFQSDHEGKSALYAVNVELLVEPT